MRVLMREERIISRNVLQALVLDHRTRPRLPRLRRHWVRRRADRQQVDHHQFTVMFPASLNEARLRMPAHGKRWSTVQHPGPVHALVDFGREVPDLVVREMLPHCEYAAEEKGSI